MTAVAEPPALELPAGYYRDRWYGTRALMTLPWPADLSDLPPSIGPQIINWAEWRTYDETGVPGLIHPITGEKWQFTPGQRRYLHQWYSWRPDAEVGARWIWRRGVIRGAKGTGKDPRGAALCNIEFIGPARLAVHPDTGEWVGSRHRMPLVQVASNSEAQSKDVLRIANAMLPSETRQYFGIDCGQTRTILKDTGGRFEILTASEETAEGDPATFIFLNEALALDTPIPTPSGWTTMGALSVGDLVLSPDGRPSRVVKATETYEGRPCYRVTFGDGDTIVADAGHLWEVRDARRPDRGVRVVTTADLAAGGRWMVRTPEPVDLPEADLPVEPYLLGVWLGDGTRGQVAITTGAEDVSWWMAESLRLGWPLRFRRQIPTGIELTFAAPQAKKGPYGAGFRAGLLRAGVLDDKHVPEVYLRASADQRLSLLQGLVDTDGCVDKNGRVIFVNTNERLADAVAELARSLGHVVQRSARDDNRKASYQLVHRVEWVGRSDRPSARMSRKVSRLLPPTCQSGWVRVAAVTAAPSVPVRCIAVDSADHLFLASGFKTTHNTHHMTSTNGGHKTAAVARRNVGKSPIYIQARMCDGTNAHMQGEDTIAERTYQAWLDQVEGRSKLVDILYDSIEAPPNTNLADEDSLREGIRAAYCDAPWTDIERKIGEVYDSETTLADSIRYYLNGLGEDEDAWCSVTKFNLLARRNDMQTGQQITMFLDCSKSSDTTALMGCRLSDGFVFTLGCWSRPPGKRGETWLAPREEVDAKVRATFDTYRVEWFGVDPSPALDDSDESLYWMALVDAWHRDYRKKLKVWATGGDVRGSSVLFDMRIKTLGGPQRNAQFTQAAMMTRLDIDEFGTLVWDGDPRLRRHVSHAKRRPNPWGESLSKKTRGSSDHVDLAVAMVGARMGRRIVLNSGKVRQRSGKAAF